MVPRRFWFAFVVVSYQSIYKLYTNHEYLTLQHKEFPPESPFIFLKSSESTHIKKQKASKHVHALGKFCDISFEWARCCLAISTKSPREMMGFPMTLAHSDVSKTMHDLWISPLNFIRFWIIIFPWRTGSRRYSWN